MNTDILIPILAAIPATLLALAALITSIKNATKLNDNAATIAAAAVAVAATVKAAAVAAEATAVAAAKAAAAVAIAAEKANK